MSFSFRVAKGVRIRVSSRCVRTSLGNARAMLYVGGGRSGVSTGVGRFGYYTSIGGGRRGARSSSRSSRSVVSYQRQLQQAEKTQEAQRLLDAINGILSLHRQDFLPVQPPVAAAAAPVNEGQIRARHEKQALSGIGLLKRAERKSAKAYAARSAETEIEAEQQRLVQERAEEQEQLDRWWQALLANHPATVLEFIVAAFEDNEAPAAPLSLQGDGLSVVVAVPPPDGLPERIPDRTAAGNL